MKPTDLHKYFCAALRQWLDQEGHGAQRRLSDLTGISPSYINDIVKGRRFGTEEYRRIIASAIGVPYEEFLAIGEKLLNGKLASADMTSGSIPIALDHILSMLPEHSLERAIQILRYAAVECGFKDVFANIQAGIFTYPPDWSAYLSGGIDDLHLLCSSRQHLERLASVFREHTGKRDRRRDH